MSDVGHDRIRSDRAIELPGDGHASRLGCWATAIVGSLLLCMLAGSVGPDATSAFLLVEDGQVVDRVPAAATVQADDWCRLFPVPHDVNADWLVWYTGGSLHVYDRGMRVSQAYPGIGEDAALGLAGDRVFAAAASTNHTTDHAWVFDLENRRWTEKITLPEPFWFTYSLQGGVMRWFREIPSRLSAYDLASQQFLQQGVLPRDLGVEHGQWQVFALSTDGSLAIAYEENASSVPTTYRFWRVDLRDGTTTLVHAGEYVSLNGVTRTDIYRKPSITPETCGAAALQKQTPQGWQAMDAWPVDDHHAVGVVTEQTIVVAVGGNGRRHVDAPGVPAIGIEPGVPAIGITLLAWMLAKRRITTVGAENGMQGATEGPRG